MLHKHPYGNDIPSQRSSELFQSITEDAKMQFFHLQGKRRVKKEYWAYDSTSISSYSENLRQVKYGKNKDGEKLPQINLALIFGENSGLPFYYRKLAGNITDVKTIRELLRELDVLGYEKIKLVMDRGYYSVDNINALYKLEPRRTAMNTITVIWSCMSSLGRSHGITNRNVLTKVIRSMKSAACISTCISIRTSFPMTVRL